MQIRRAGRFRRAHIQIGPVLSLATFLIAGAAQADGDLGRDIYTAGRGSGPITVEVGARGTKVPATAVPCANCHGVDGKGRPERGVVPPDITWAELTKPYGHLRADGRRAPPYTAESLRRALETGLESGGTQLATEMPRFTFTDEDFAALVGYLRVLGHEDEAGVTDTSIRIATALPLDGPAAEAGRVMLSVIRGVIDATNASGGIYGRQIDLAVATISASHPPAETLARLATTGDYFAIISPYAVGDEAAVREAADQTGVPVFAPYGRLTDQRERPDAETFYLGAGVGEQLSALIRHASRVAGAKALPVALVAGRDVDQTTIDAITARAVKEGFPGVETFQADAPGKLADGIRAGTFSAVAFLTGIDPFTGLLGEGDTGGHDPLVLVPAGYASAAVFTLPPGYEGRVFIGYPSLPKDGSRKAAEDLKAIQVATGVGGAHAQAQFHAFDSTRLMIEALKRVGQELTRPRLLAAMDDFRNFKPGLSAPVTYRANRRVGSTGAHIVAVDIGAKRFRPTGTFVEME